MPYPTLRLACVALLCMALSPFAPAEPPRQSAAAAAQRAAPPPLPLRHVGVCHAVLNTLGNRVQDASGNHPKQARMEPYADLSAYFDQVERRDLHRRDRVLGNLDTTTAQVVRAPQHGALLAVACDPRVQFCEHPAYYYQPQPGFIGSDQVVVEASLNGQSALLYYAVQVIADRRAPACERLGRVFALPNGGAKTPVAH